ncbi:MAG TPA: hypothetical protein PK006_02910 [Saprospiraceae bacterium]|nr:hypothetical protein [Saprospiraceae bacterium]
MNQLSYKYFEGVDLLNIEGVNESTIIVLMSEVGIKRITKMNLPNNLHPGYDWRQTIK